LPLGDRSPNTSRVEVAERMLAQIDAASLTSSLRAQVLASVAAARSQVDLGRAGILGTYQAQLSIHALVTASNTTHAALTSLLAAAGLDGVAPVMALMLLSNVR